mmetsp:Transcript_86689/g.197863  ORF Transcript_86689/g.197863 Transcript_86689/m.197863 type:complete len:223 (-) Transcript_86689:140-808(-)
MPSAWATTSDMLVLHHRTLESTCGALPPGLHSCQQCRTWGGQCCWRAAFGTQQSLPSGSRGPQKEPQPPGGCWGVIRMRIRPTSAKRSTSSLSGFRRRTCTKPPPEPWTCQKQCSQRNAHHTRHSAAPASPVWSCPTRRDRQTNWHSYHSRGPDTTLLALVTAECPAGAAIPRRFAQAAEELHHLPRPALSHQGMLLHCLAASSSGLGRPPENTPWDCSAIY